METRVFAVREPRSEEKVSVFTESQAKSQRQLSQVPNPIRRPNSPPILGVVLHKLAFQTGCGGIEIRFVKKSPSVFT